MPIKNAFWNQKRGWDLHVLKGESSPDLTVNHLRVNPAVGNDVTLRAYLDAQTVGHEDVTVKFTPLIKSVPRPDPNEHILVGHGVEFDTRTGVVKVDDPLPVPHLRNFIIVAEITDVTARKTFRSVIRIHVHSSVTAFWLTPKTLTLRPNDPPGSTVRPDRTGYKFTARVLFNDGTLGDVTEDHNITWFPANLFNEFDEIVLRPGDIPGGAPIEITALLPVALGGASAKGTLKLDESWGGPPIARIVAGGAGPAKVTKINPAVVPNVLFLCDGFMDKPPVDENKIDFELITDFMVHRLRTSRFTTPFNKLASSMNFWRCFLPSEARGINVMCEVYTIVEDGELRGYIVDDPEDPAGAAVWELRHVIYSVGLPVRADHISNAARSDEEIREEWGKLYSPDPNPNITDDLLLHWRHVANRTFVEEKDTPFCMAYGEPPRVWRKSDTLFVDFHPRRMKRQRNSGEVQSRFDVFLANLRDESGFDLGDVWAEKNLVRPPNYDLVFILTSSKQGRAVNRDGYISLDVETDGFLNGLVVGTNNTLLWNPPTPNADLTLDQLASVAHELAHSFGLGDEYTDLRTTDTVTASQLLPWGNLQAESELKVNGNIHGDEIKWNWRRAQKGALVLSVSPALPAGSDRWEVKVKPGHGLQFAIGDTVILRKRSFPKPPDRNTSESPQLTVSEKSTSDRVIVTGAPLGLDFGVGDVLFMPKLAPISVRSPDYPFAEVVGLNIKNLITSRKGSLTPPPCSFEQSNDKVQLPDLDPLVVKLDLLDLPKIVGLYDGGSHVACGVFHPAGTCMMNGGDLSLRSFCAVCRYVLVELIDPFKHYEIDLDYDRIYPQV